MMAKINLIIRYFFSKNSFFIKLVKLVFFYKISKISFFLFEHSIKKNKNMGKINFPY